MTAIVVPVFNAVAQTQRCLAALLRHQGDAEAVIVIDDASTDPAVAALMAELPDTWVRVSNERNLGFVATANLGMALARRADVVLLNADTEVSPGWLAAIETCAASDPRIASITPFTNHGEIASLPEWCAPNPWPEDIDRWAHAAAALPAEAYCDVPTAVGFCMYLRRASLDEVGGFDELAFGRGYGEENDWCLRAAALGWRHVLCHRAFVAHEGGASFAPLGLKPGGQAMDTLLNRHPDYLNQVNRFIEADPLRAHRQALMAHYQALC